MKRKLTTAEAAADLINTVVTVTATGVAGTAVDGISAVQGQYSPARG